MTLIPGPRLSLNGIGSPWSQLQSHLSSWELVLLNSPQIRVSVIYVRYPPIPLRLPHDVPGPRSSSFPGFFSLKPLRVLAGTGSRSVGGRRRTTKREDR